MPWELDNDRPIYLQLMERIQHDIISGVYKPGDKMSSETDGTDQRQICRCNECEKRKETVPQEFQGFKKAGFRDCLFLYF